MFPFDNKDHPLIIGESFIGHRKYDKITYDFKPQSIDTDKEGILETADNTSTIHLPHKDAGKSINYKGKRTQENGKECLIIVNHDTGEITLERINTRAVVRIQRGADSEVYDFKPTTFTPRTVLPVKREHRPEPIIMPTVAPPTQNAQPIRPQKQPRSAPIVKKKPKREEEIPVDFELPSIIKHQMEPIDTNVPILGLGGFKPSPKSHHPAAQSQPPAQPPAPEPTSGLFSTSEESNSSGSSSEDGDSSSDSDDDSDKSDAGKSTSPPASQPLLQQNVPVVPSVSDFGLDLSDEDSDDSG